MVALGNPLEGPHIGELNHQRVPASAHQLRNGHPCFRLTQTFDNPDFYWSNHGHPERTHGACDFGNFNCGDKVLAARAGVARRYVDSAGALAVIIQHQPVHGQDLKTYYWHLNAWTIPTGSVTVVEGEQIGVVGKTGLGAVCHMHFEVHLGGRKVDPWPLLRQNGATEESDVDIQGTFVKHISNRKTKVLSDIGSRFREGPFLSAPILQVFPKTTIFIPTVEVAGDEVLNSRTWYGGWLYVSEIAPSKYRFGYMHNTTVEPLAQIEEGLTEADIANQLAHAKHLGERDAASGMLAASTEKSKEYLS